MLFQANTSLEKQAGSLQKHANPALQNNNDRQTSFEEFLDNDRMKLIFFFSEEAFTWIDKALNTIALLN